MTEPKLMGSCKGQLRILADIDSEPAVLQEDWGLIDRPEQVLDSEGDA